MTAQIIDLKVTIVDDAGKPVFKENIFAAKHIVDCMIRDESEQATKADRKTINNFIKQVGLQGYHPTPVADILTTMIYDTVLEHKRLTVAQ